MKRKLVLLASYFGLTPLIILSLIFYSLYLLHAQSPFNTSIRVFTKNVHFRALPEVHTTMQASAAPEDARVSVLHEFFMTHKSPLVAYADDIVKAADANGLDYRLLPAIAMQESNLCRKIPKDSFNCWGFGIYGGKVTKFEDYGHAIEVVAKSLAIDYKEAGLADPHEIMVKYTPGSNGSWAQSVTYFMESIHSSL